MATVKDYKDLDQATVIARVLEERFPGLVEETAGLLGRSGLKLAAKGARVAAARTERQLARDALLRVAQLAR
jgi:hypothetical protein